VIVRYFCGICKKPSGPTIFSDSQTGLSTTCSEGNSSDHTPDTRCRCKISFMEENMEFGSFEDTLEIFIQSMKSDLIRLCETSRYVYRPVSTSLSVPLAMEMSSDGFDKEIIRFSVSLRSFTRCPMCKYEIARPLEEE